MAPDGKLLPSFLLPSVVCMLLLPFTFPYAHLDLRQGEVPEEKPEALAEICFLDA